MSPGVLNQSKLRQWHSVGMLAMPFLRGNHFDFLQSRSSASFLFPLIPNTEHTGATLQALFAKCNAPHTHTHAHTHTHPSARNIPLVPACRRKGLYCVYCTAGWCDWTFLRNSTHCQLKLAAVVLACMLTWILHYGYYLHVKCMYFSSNDVMRKSCWSTGHRYDLKYYINVMLHCLMFIITNNELERL